MKKENGKRIGFLAGGILLGTAGISVLKSQEARKAYTCVTAAFLRAKDGVMDCVSDIQEGVMDVYMDAIGKNNARIRKAEAAKIEDEA